MQKRHVTLDQFHRILEEYNEVFIQSKNKKCKHEKLVEWQLERVYNFGIKEVCLTSCYVCPLCGTGIKNIGNYKVIDIDFVNRNSAMRNEVI